MTNLTTNDTGARVLVAIDFSDASDEAIRQGHERARAAGGELVVCHVVPDSLASDPLFPQRVEAETERALALEQAAAEAITRRVDAVTEGHPRARVIVTSGAPDEAIVRTADEIEATLTIVSTHDDRLEERLVESVAARVARSSHMPVLIARPHRSGAVLAATDFDSAERSALDAAAEEASTRHVPLTVLHAIDAFPRSELGWAATPQVDVHVRTVGGDAASGIISTARELDADLVVVGCHERSGRRRMELGSVAERVVREAPCSVLVVHG